MARNSATVLKEWNPREETRPRRKVRPQIRKVLREDNNEPRPNIIGSRSVKLLLLGIVILALLLTLSFIAERYMAIFTVKTVRFEGELHHPLAYQLEDTLTPYVKGDFFRVDISAAQQALTLLPWVRSAIVKREWPDTIVVSVQEQIAVARWNESLFINDDAKIFESDSKYQSASLPQLYGSDDQSQRMLQQLNAFNQILSGAGLSVTLINLDKRGSWSLTSSDGIDVNLGNENPAQRLRRYVIVYRENIINQAINVEHVDLRHSNGIAVRWRDGISQATQLNKVL